MGHLVKGIVSWLIRTRLQVNMAKGSFLSVPYLGLSGGKYISLGQDTTIGKHAWLAAFESFHQQQYAPLVTIGNNVTIGNYFCLTAIDRIAIGDGCLFSEYVYISDHSHGTDPRLGPPATQPLHSKGPVQIGDNTFLGYRVSVLPGVSLGKHCVVGAHSVVTRSFPDYSVIAGVPARLLKQVESTSSLS